MPTMNGLLSSKLNNTEFLRGIADRKNISFHGTLQPNIWHISMCAKNKIDNFNPTYRARKL